MIHHQDRRITRIMSEDRAAKILICGGRQIFPGKRRWMPPFLECYLTRDSVANWMDVSFVSGFQWSGSAATHWTDPTGTFRMWLESSFDLRVWRRGEFSDLGVFPHADGWEYRARNATPNYYQDVMVDIHIRSDRYGKTIEALDLLTVPISLPNYPYSIPDDLAQLQTDLRAAGLDGATVTHTTAVPYARIRHHHPEGAYTLQYVKSGSDITSVSDHGTPISLPNYPYSIPDDAAQLQTDLQANYSANARVTLYAGEWHIMIPDIVATGQQRSSLATISPADPYPVYNMFEEYQGDAPGNTVQGTSDNVRAPTGAPLRETTKQFARLGFCRLK